MIVYIETSFILDLALKQDHFNESSKILRKAERQEIVISLPFMCILEAQSKISWREREKDRIVKKCIELGLRETADSIAKTIESEQNTFKKVIYRLIKIVEPIYPDYSKSYKRSWRNVKNLKLEPVDALILTITIDNAESISDKKIFLTYDRDFDKDVVRKKCKEKFKIDLILTAKECLKHIP